MAWERGVAGPAMRQSLVPKHDSQWLGIAESSRSRPALMYRRRDGLRSRTSSATSRCTRAASDSQSAFRTTSSGRPWAVERDEASRTRVRSVRVRFPPAGARWFSSATDEEGAPTLDRVRHLADIFDVSLTAAGLAYMRVCSEACAMVYSQDGRREVVRAKHRHGGHGAWVFIGPMDKYTVSSAFFRWRPLQIFRGVSTPSPGFSRRRFAKTQHQRALDRDAYLQLDSVTFLDR